jgi:anti-sigma factor RsiW
MTVTRDVIYDLLPAYFGGDASPDTRALVEDFFASDPEFGRMAARFQTAADRARQGGAASADAERERQSFSRVRARLGLRYAALGWVLGAALAFAIALFTPADGRFGWQHPGIIIGLVFSLMAGATWIVSYRDDAPWWYEQFSGQKY